MSRLAFGPQPKRMEVTDIATGHFVFAPTNGEKVSYAALAKAIIDAGYEIEVASIRVSGTLIGDLHLETPEGQQFRLSPVDEELKSHLRQLEPGTGWTVEGGWEMREGTETIAVRKVREKELEEDAGRGSR